MRSVVAIASSVVILHACNTEASLECTIEVDPSVSTLLHLRWTAPAGAISQASFGVEGEAPLETDPVSGEEVTLDLLGMPAETDVQWSGFSEVDGERLTCEGTARTGSLPGDLDPVTVDVDVIDPDDSPRFLLGTYYRMLSSSYLVAIDRRGRIVWYHQPDSDGFAVQVQPTLDGSGLIYNLFPAGLDTLESQIVRIDPSGAVLETIETPDAHHMFAQLGGGALAYQGVDVRPWTDDTGVTEDWAGDTIVEVSADRELETVFDVWDQLTPSRNDYMEGFSPYRGLDWTHGNALKVDEATERYLLSLGHAGTILEIERASASVVRSFGEQGYGPVGGESFRYQHDPSLLADGSLLMFATDVDSSNTMAIRYTIDDDAHSLTEMWRYDTGIPSLYLGQARLLENGHVWVNTGEGAVMREVTQEGEVLWQVTAPSGQTFGQFEPLDRLVLAP